MGVTIWQSMSDMTEKMVREAFRGIDTLEDWQRVRSERCREFARCLGLDPLPERCDLDVRDYGEFSGQGFRARRIGFQVMPGCWGSASIYYPDPAPADPAPGVLYVCGHAPIGTFRYQYHPIMWARRGYVCLIVDTIEQNDNPGEHHGMSRGSHYYDQWTSLGYTSTGGEVWNSVRALDVLAADERVDADRLGVTGLSGGGSISFHLAVFDERIKAVSSLCGVSTPFDGVANRHLINHCNCIYTNNIYRRDTSEYAALIAPRALQFCFADDDSLFHPDETRALAERTSRIYRLYDEPGRCRLITCPGKHGDHPEFDEATSRLFDEFVAGEKRPTVPLGVQELPETTTGIFNGKTPAPNHLDLLPFLLSARGGPALPEKPGDWPAIRRAALESLPRLGGRDSEGAVLEADCAWHIETRIQRSYRGQVAGVDIWLSTGGAPGCRPRLVLGVAGPGETCLDVIGEISTALESGMALSGGLETRLAGINSPAPESGSFPFSAKETALCKMLPFAFSLVGSTPVMMMIEDLRLALDFLAGREELKNHDIFLFGTGDAGVAAIYGALLDERVAGVAAVDIPGSHLDGAPIMGILRALDLPQAVGLVAPRPVALVQPGHNYWTWPTRAFERLGCPENFIRDENLPRALTKLLGEN